MSPACPFFSTCVTPWISRHSLAIIHIPRGGEPCTNCCSMHICGVEKEASTYESPRETREMVQMAPMFQSICKQAIRLIVVRPLVTTARYVPGNDRIYV